MPPLVRPSNEVLKNNLVLNEGQRKFTINASLLNTYTPAAAEDKPGPEFLSAHQRREL